MDAYVRAFLADAGYRILERRHEWCECLLLGHGESWLGVGADEGEAFERAIALCFPSSAARRALERAAVPEGSLSQEATPSVTGAQLLQEVSAIVAGAVVEATEAGGPLSAVHDEAVNFAVPAAADSSAPEESGRRTATVLVRGPSEADRRAAQEAMDALEETIDRMRGEVSRLSPRRQRLVLLGWLAEARSWQTEGGVSGPVPAVVKKLRALTESWWPGTISAFQVHSTPAATRTRDLRGFVSEAPRSWDEVASLAAAALHAVEAEESAAGWDDDGWADRTQTLPPPPDPSSLLQALAQEVENEGGALGGFQPKGGVVPPAALLERWARQLRWLRGTQEEDERWGMIAGRLRFWAQRPLGFSTAAEYLDPGYRPPRSWAALFDATEQSKRDARDLERVLRSVPSVGADDEALVAWLDQALPLTSSHQNTILQACAGLHERILDVDEVRLGDADRRIRRRLQKLKQAIAGRDTDAPANRVLESPDLDAERIASEVEPVPEELLARTKGKRVLFVGNRADGELQERLHAMLGLDRLEWSEATPRRVDAAVEAIGSRAYDLVLGATGFMGHKYDGRLARACKSAGIPYVRADRGRPAAVVRALSRELGGPAAVAR